MGLIFPRPGCQSKDTKIDTLYVICQIQPAASGRTLLFDALVYTLAHMRFTPAVHPGPAKANCHGNGLLKEVRVSWLFLDGRTGDLTERKGPN